MQIAHSKKPQVHIEHHKLQNGTQVSKFQVFNEKLLHNKDKIKTSTLKWPWMTWLVSAVICGLGDLGLRLTPSSFATVLPVGRGSNGHGQRLPTQKRQDFQSYVGLIIIFWLDLLLESMYEFQTPSFLPDYSKMQLWSFQNNTGTPAFPNGSVLGLLRRQTSEDARLKRSNIDAF